MNFYRSTQALLKVHIDYCRCIYRTVRCKKSLIFTTLLSECTRIKYSTNLTTPVCKSYWKKKTTLLRADKYCYEAKTGVYHESTTIKKTKCGLNVCINTKKIGTWFNHVTDTCKNTWHALCSRRHERGRFDDISRLLQLQHSFSRLRTTPQNENNYNSHRQEDHCAENHSNNDWHEVSIWAALAFVWDDCCTLKWENAREKQD